MTQSSDVPLSSEERSEMADIFAFMKGLCDVSSEALSGLQAQASPGASGDDEVVLRRDKIILIPCRPIELPQPPPTSSGDGCYLPEGLPGRFEVVADVKGLAMLFGHLRSICEEILDRFPGGGVEAS